MARDPKSRAIGDLRLPRPSASGCALALKSDAVSTLVASAAAADTAPLRKQTRVDLSPTAGQCAGSGNDP